MGTITILKIAFRRLAIVTISLSTFIALPAVGQAINEDLKLTASDGAAGDGFGNSIAMNNGIVAVGALVDDDNGDASGSVCLFDASTGAQLFKLLPSDGAAHDQFGYFIDIDNGIVAVGSPDDDDDGNKPGSAYVFDTGTGAACLANLNNDATLNFFDVSAFLVAFNANDPIADFNNDALFNFFDVSAFIIAFAQGCP